MLSQPDIAVRLLLSALLGSLIGFERERLLWAAGIRTHMLVCVGACLFMIVSAYGFEDVVRTSQVVLDPSRIAAQVVSGIGFLGAGAILLRGQSVRGLTTAASIWSVAALGLAVGGGLYFAAGFSTFIILVILAGIKPLEMAYRKRIQSRVVDTKAERGAIEPDDLADILGVRASQIRSAYIDRGGDDLDNARIHLVRVSEEEIRTAAERLREHPGVQDVTVSRPTAPLARDHDDD